MLLKQGLPEVGLVAELALEGPLPVVLVLPHVVVQVTLSHKLLLADLTLVRLLALVLHPANTNIVRFNRGHL